MAEADTFIFDAQTSPPAPLPDDSTGSPTTGEGSASFFFLSPSVRSVVFPFPSLHYSSIRVHLCSSVVNSSSLGILYIHARNTYKRNSNGR